MLFARYLVQRVVFGDRSIRQRVQATSHVSEQSLPHQPREGNSG